MKSKLVQKINKIPPINIFTVIIMPPLTITIAILNFIIWIFGSTDGMLLLYQLIFCFLSIPFFLLLLILLIRTIIKNHSFQQLKISYLIQSFYLLNIMIFILYLVINHVES